jgi:predicted permease
MLARASARRQELSVRLALGASRGRIARQMLAEALLLSAVGTAIGLWLSQWASALLVRQMSSSASVIALDLSMDWRVLAVTAAIGIITTIFFALAPVAGFAGVDPSQALGSAVRGTVSDRRATVRNALVIVQVALSLILVVAAGLFVRTFHGLASMPLGFAPENLLIVSVDASRSPVSQEALPGLYQRAAEAAATVPGVRSASSSLITPMSGRGWNNRVGMPDGSEPPRDRMTFENAVGPEWFTTYGMRILAGRALTPLDGSGSPRVAVVNEMFAKRFLADAPPVGARVTVGQPPSAQTYEVVGVVNDAVYRSARRGVVPTMYHPLEQAGTLNTSFSVTLDVPGDRRALGPGLRDALRKVDPALAFSVRPYSDQIGGAIAQERLVALLSGVFGTLALLLAAIGLYGVTAYAVSRRTRELAMRMALGASRSDVMRLVLRNVTVVVGTGAAIGIAFSLWASGFVTAMLFGVQPRDPITLVTAATVLVMTGLLAGWLPARRASRLDPNAVLRR